MTRPIAGVLAGASCDPGKEFQPDFFDSAARWCKRVLLIELEERSSSESLHC